MNFSEQSNVGRTHGLCGWALRDLDLTREDTSSKAMGEGLRTILPIHSAEKSNSACATTGELVSFGSNGYAAIVGTPFWRCPDLQRVADNAGNAEALVEAYQRYGDRCLDRIANDFCLCIVDPLKKKTLAAVDRMGRHSLYYSVQDEQLVFGSTAEAVLSHVNVAREPDPQGVYNYVYFHMIPAPGTMFKHVKKLQAGTFITFDTSEFHVGNYWLPKFGESMPANFNSMKNEMRHSLSLAVKRAMGDSKNVGAFLSGGLDSSTVTGMLSERSRVQPRAFSIGFDAEGYDEMEYARKTAKHFGVELNEYYVTPDDVVNALPFIATSYDEPFGNSSALPAWFCARLAHENGIETLLAGDGGDELFAGNERYAKQKIFELYGYLPAFMRNGLFEPIASRFSEKSALFSKLSSYIEQANVPLPDRLQSYNFLHRHLPNEIFGTDFLGEINAHIPIELQRKLYQAPENASSLNRMLYLDWQITLADNDLRKVSHMCAMAGVDVAYPMIDDDLMEFSCRVPSNQKLRGQDLRSFFKKSLKGWLHDDTLSKSKQGFGLPFGVWMQTHKPLQELAYDSLLSMRKRNIFDAKFLEKLIDLHKSGHAAYYGVLIWVLTVLELWMENHYSSKP